MGKVAKVYLDDTGDKLVEENTKFCVEKRRDKWCIDKMSYKEVEWRLFGLSL